MGKGHQDKHSWWTWGRLAAILGALSAAGGRLGGVMHQQRAQESQNPVR